MVQPEWTEREYHYLENWPYGTSVEDMQRLNEVMPRTFTWMLDYGDEPVVRLMEYVGDSDE